jgi:hypothetical protein
MDFYAVLPSNASPDIFAKNTTSNFKVQLSERLELHGNWQLALLEVHYPNTLSQIDKGENWIKVFKPLSSPVSVTGPSYDVNQEQTEPVSILTSEGTYTLKTGYYPTIHELLYQLHETLTPFQALPDNRGRGGIFGVTPENHLTIHPFPACKECSYQFAPRLALQLGLSHPGPYKADAEVKGERPIDLSLGVPSQMYIYLDILKEQIVGHSRVPLLRTVPIATEARFGSLTSYRCEHPVYFDLNTKSFDSIEVNIRTDTGKFLPFHHGTLTLLVHFKERA